jgi:hypothetical protein
MKQNENLKNAIQEGDKVREKYKKIIKHKDREIDDLIQENTKYKRKNELIINALEID